MLVSQQQLSIARRLQDGMVVRSFLEWHSATMEAKRIRIILREVVSLSYMDQSVVECSMSSLWQVGDIWQCRRLSDQSPHDLRGQFHTVLNIGDLTFSVAC